ncbi:luciferin 4-monooxygenase-like [Anopheles aquasalis]|uniref:luciferin 4-monooxygenase-like n=1 Tax=Anopheles aquasalis TaxID=42839 RepID=UPI00215AC913|nr:luciferin 4-monooxygenase-like [Anopheles aquasalis]
MAAKDSARDDERFIQSGPPHRSDITAGCGSLGAFVHRKLQQHGSAVALHDGLFGTQATYLELLEQGARMAECLRTVAGVRSGDAVGLASENRLEFPVVVIGAFLLGASVAPVNLTYSEHEFEHAFQLSRPRIVFASPYAADRIIAVAERRRDLIPLVVLFSEDEETIGEDPAVSGQFVKLLGQFLAPVSSVNPRSLDHAPTDVHEHVALIMCSSGTTGLPKGVQLTQANVMASVALTEEANAMTDLGGEQLVLLCVLPWFHAFGCLSLLNVLCNGERMVALPQFEETTYLTCIEQYRCNTLLTVPPLVLFLAKHPLVADYDLTSVHTIICGAAPLASETEALVRQRLPSVRFVRQGYGMSELTLATLVQSGDGHTTGSVGRPQIGTQVKVCDPETGRILGPGERGELCFRGSQVMKGYVRDEEATRQTIDADGWLHSGDIGYYDADGEFYVIDRLKELIKYKGSQVPPAEIEAVLLGHPLVQDAAVIGVPDETAGELPMAFVVLQAAEAKADQRLRPEHLVDYVAKRVSPAKRLRGGVRFIDAIPKNLSGKVLRRELRELAKSYAVPSLSSKL